MAYNDFESSFENILSQENGVRIHQKNLQLLAIEIYKTVNNLNPVFMKEIFQLNELANNLRNQSFIQKKPNTVTYGLDTISYRCDELWSSIPLDIRSTENCKVYKTKIKQTDLTCSCRLCTPYIANIVYCKHNNFS